MLRNNLWKLTFTLAIVAWALATLLPLQDRPFADYAKASATAKTAEFAKLMDEAASRKQSGQAMSEFVALKQIGKERRLDLSQYFPDIRLEEKLKNIEKRNEGRIKERAVLRAKLEQENNEKKGIK